MGDLDRRKHDVDIIERVLGGIRDSETFDRHARIIDVDLPWDSDSGHPTLEVTVDLDDDLDTLRDRRPSSR